MTNSSQILAEGLELLAERGGDPVAAVHARLFAAHPQMEAQSVRDTTGAVRGEMLAVAFECIVDIGGAGPYAPKLIAAERVNHQGVGAPPEIFGRVFPRLAETCRELLGEVWTPDVDAAWSELLARIAVLTAI